VVPRSSPQLLAAVLLLAVALAPASGRAEAEATSLAQVAPEVLAQASAGGKYADLVATFEVPEDEGTYGKFRDYGAWGGGTYRGVPNRPGGFWVYVAPRWYVWRKLAPRVPSEPSPPAPAPSTSPPSAPAPAPAPNVTRPRPDMDERHPARPVERDPSLDGPFGPVHRYLQGKKTGVALSERDAAQGFMVPVIRTSDGGYLFSALRDDRTQADRDLRDRDGNRVYMVGKTVPLLVKLDAGGNVAWERVLKKNGFLDYGAGLVAELKDGHYVAMVPSFVHPGRWPVYRFVALKARSGEVAWERQLRGTGGRNSPAVDTARVTERGTLALEGRIYLEEGSSAVSSWRGEIGADGKLRADRTGPIQDASGGGPVGAWDLDERSRGALFLRSAASGSSSGYRQFLEAYRYALRSQLVLAPPDRQLAPGIGLMIPIIETSGGGTLLVGVRYDGTSEERRAQPSLAGRTRPVVVKLDAAGKPEWERSFEKAGFDAYGAGLAGEAPDGGYLVWIPSYDLATWGFSARFLKLDREGKVLWERPLPVTGSSGRSPEVEKVRLGERGTLLIRGFAYVDATYRTTRTYDGEIDSDGRLLVNELAPAGHKRGTVQLVGPDGKPI